jgi:AcrR family transcriptional regulator
MVEVPRSTSASRRGERRPYNSPVRRQQAAATRERIVAAGAELLHGFPVWNWSALTVRAVAERARVNDRTVYRHFANERQMRDAVLARMRDEAGVDLDGLRLEDVGDTATRIFEYVSSFPIEARTSTDPTVAAENERQRATLLAAVGSARGRWSDGDRRIAAAVLDVLWSPVSYERLVLDWRLAPDDAIRGLVWLIGLVEAAVRRAAPPPAALRGRAPSGRDARRSAGGPRAGGRART